MPAGVIASSHDGLPQTRIWGRHKFASDVAKLSLFAIAYLVACGYGTIFQQTAASPLWFPDSVLLCALLLAPRGRWWLYLAIALPIRFVPIPHPAIPLWFLWATSLNDLIKAPLAAYLLQRFTKSSIYLERLSQLATYFAVAVFFVPLMSAAAGAATRYLLGFSFWTSWYQWFLGDALANLVLTPALLYWCSKSFRFIRPVAAELLLWVSGFALALYLALRLAHSSYSPIAFCVPVPFLIWAAMRFGPIGASTGLSVIALLGTVRLTERAALFSMGLESKSLLFLQLFLFVISVPVLCLAILIEERKAVEKNLRDSETNSRRNYEEARYLAGRLINAQEDERKRIAMELHDDAGQRLALLAVQLETLEHKVPAEMKETHDALLRIREEMAQAASTLRELSHQLHSSALQYLGLYGALNGLCRAIAEKHHVAVKLEAHGRYESSYEIQLCFFRIAQEALSNAIKHGNPGEIVVRLFHNRNQFCLEIRDDGNGFNPSERFDGLGLTSMRERIRLLNGTITIESKPMGGTIVDARVPFASGHSAKRAAG